MFDELNNQVAPTPATPTPTPAVVPEAAVQDIFASVESPAPVAPVSSQPFGQSDVPTNVPTNSQMTGRPEKKTSSAAKTILIGLAILIIVAIGALAYLQYFKKTPLEVITPEPINTEASLLATSTQTSSEPTEATVTESIIDTETVSSTETLPGEAITLEPAATTGTETVASPEAAADLDSDQDGLTDAEELNVYQTNPLKADSDGDGYLDGDEVKGGYNPLGEGKLVQ